MYSKLLIAGCLVLGSVGASAGVSAPAGVPVYDATQLALGSYTVVERVGFQGWQSAFSVSGYPTADEARNAVLATAARVVSEERSSPCVCACP